MYKRQDIDPVDMDMWFYRYETDEGPVVYTLGDYKVLFDRMNVFQRPKKSDLLGSTRSSITQEMDKALLNRGIAYGKRGEFRQAAADFDRTLELKPGQANALVYRAEALARLGYLQASLDDLNQALRLVGNDPKWTNQLKQRIGQLRQMMNNP